MERYDRELKDGKIKRIHQEDICQSLNVPEENKYLVPSTDIVKLLINNSGKNSQYNIETFFKALLLSNLIGSEDGHAKNYSLMLQNYNIKLAPIYDVFSVYDNTYDLNKTYKTAMKIGDCNIIGKLKIIDIRTFAKKNKLIFDNLLSITKEICERLPNIIEKVFYENSNIKELLEFKDVMIYNVNLNCNNLLNDIKNNS
ncbi:hypothetical protein FACS189459_1260 [Bacilli bacterium]|nr:hypothetical protein FACS189459_1260 [Bacilli bacterium]